MVVTLYTMSLYYNLSTDKSPLQLLTAANELGIIILAIVGVMNLLAGYGLWKMKLYGGMLGLVRLGASLSSGIYYLQGDDVTLFIGLGADILLLVLVIVNWKSLK